MARIWVGHAAGNVYVALFNPEDGGDATVAVSMTGVGLGGQRCTVREVWTDTPRGVTGASLSAKVAAHGVALLELSQCKPLPAG